MVQSYFRSLHSGLLCRYLKTFLLFNWLNWVWSLVPLVWFGFVVLEIKPRDSLMKGLYSKDGPHSLLAGLFLINGDIKQSESHIWGAYFSWGWKVLDNRKGRYSVLILYSRNVKLQLKRSYLNRLSSLCSTRI